MSTHYYIKGAFTEGQDKDSYDWHIGRRNAAGAGKTVFTWEMDPSHLTKRLVELEYIGETDKCIVDERGQEYTHHEFIIRIIRKGAICFSDEVWKKVTDST